MNSAMPSCTAVFGVNATVGALRRHDGSDLSRLRERASTGGAVSPGFMGVRSTRFGRLTLRSIDNAFTENPEDLNRLNFGESSYVNGQGKVQPMYRLTKTALCFVVLGLTGSEAGHWKAAYIEAFGATAGTLGEDSSDFSPLRKPAPGGDVVSARSSSENPADFGRLNFQESSPVSLLSLAEAGMLAAPDGSTAPILSRLPSRPARASASTRRAPDGATRSL